MSVSSSVELEIEILRKLRCYIKNQVDKLGLPFADSLSFVLIRIYIYSSAISMSLVTGISSGWIAGSMGLIVGHPFDTVKVNQQTQGIPTLQCAKNIFHQFGYKGFFRGLAFPLIANGAINSLLFGVYGTTLDAILYVEQAQNAGQANRLDSSTLFTPADPLSSIFFQSFAAGCVAGTAQLAISCPVDVIKIKLQTQQKSLMVGSTEAAKFGINQRITGPLRLLRHLVSTYGIRGIYQGVMPMAYRDVPASGAYMCLYETCSRWVKGWGKDKHESVNILGIFIAGGIAGTISWWLILPLDVIKSRVQADNPKNPKYKGFVDCASQVLRDHGVKGFFRGFWPMTIRAFPVNGVVFITLEWMKKLCRYLNENDPSS